ncbi:MAG: ABC transporter permease [Acidobacteria bacterium]|nr:ABC transporter permease [Acidobacteriota bacterium]
MNFFRNDILENLKMAMDTLRMNKMRSFLTVLGVVIGVWTVMAIASIISGIDYAVTKQIESIGTNSIFVTKTERGVRFGPPTREERMRKPLTYEDAVSLGELPSVSVSTPILNITNDYFGRKLVVKSSGKESAAVVLQGVTPEYEQTGIWVMSAGRFFTKSENDSREEVCVIGSSVAEQFFPMLNPLDKMLTIGGREFRVIGVLEKREQLFGGGEGSNDQNNIIFMPFSLAQKLKPRADDVYITVVAKPGMLTQALDEVTGQLRIRRQVLFDQPNNFGLATADGIISTFRSITFGVALAMVVISSVGLMVGGIGVMNIMLVSVTERTREIGIRKAIGGRRRDILWQFLIEAMTLTGMGGLIGLGIGWLTTLLIRMVVPSYVPLWAPIAGFVSSVGIGLVFGLWPAWKAARLDPIVALRYE